LPSGFFIISTTFECITIGHFTGLIVNGNKIMTEIKLLKEGRWEVIVNGKNIDFLALILNNKFDLKRKSVDLICDTVQKLKYCDGVPDDNYEVDITILRENVSKAGNENSHWVRYKAINCKHVLLFAAYSNTCTMCNRIICANRKKKPSNDDAIEINNNTVVLEETDHNDMAEILNKVFPNCGVKISTFLKSKKMLFSRSSMI
jgi:hypothetical protein